MKCETRNVFYKHCIKQNTHSTPSLEIPHFYQMPVTEREILVEHMGASAFEKVYGGGFSSSPHFFPLGKLVSYITPTFDRGG